MGAAPVISTIGLAGCTFLLYFLYALLREEYRARKRLRVEITKQASRRPHPTKLIRLNPAGQMRERRRLQGRDFMQDVLWIIATIAFFAISIGYIEFCDRMK